MWFNARQVAPSTGSGGGFPTGEHKGIIIGSEKKPTKNGSPNSARLVLKIQIIEGQYQGLSGDYGMNLWNDSQQASDIAAAELSALCHVTGTFELAAQPYCAEMFSKPFIFIVGPQKNDPNYNEIKGVKDINGVAPNANAGGAPQGQPAQGGFGGQPQQGQQGQQPAGNWQGQGQGQTQQQQPQGGGGYGGQPQGQGGYQQGQQQPQPGPQGGQGGNWNGAQPPNGGGQQQGAAPSNGGGNWGQPPQGGQQQGQGGGQPSWGPR